MPLKTSASARAMIEQFEGCRLSAYQDVVGVWTIGYGCTGSNVRPGMAITQAEADQMLSDRLAQEFEPAVNRLVGDSPTTQNQFDAMVSLSFNIGTGAFARSSVLRDHMAGNHAGAANAFAMWDMAGGRVLPALARRRAAEAALYRRGASAGAQGTQEAPPAATSVAQTPSHASTAAVAPPKRMVPRGAPAEDDGETEAEDLNREALEQGPQST